MIGFVVPHIRDRRDIALVSAVERQLHARGFSLALRCSCGNQADERAAVEELRDLGANGLIVRPVNSTFYYPALLQANLDRFATVLIDIGLPGIPLPHVVTDHTEAARALTRHLLSLGHSRIALVAREADDAAGATVLSDRLAGFAAAMDGAGTHPAGTLLLGKMASQPTDEPAEQAAAVARLARFFADHAPVDALLAADCRIALQAWEAITAAPRGDAPRPEIACLDGDAGGGVRACGSGLPQYTHMRQDPEAITGAAVGILADALVGAGPAVPGPVRVAARLHIRAALKETEGSVATP